MDALQPIGRIQRVDEVVAESISPVRVLGLLLLIGSGLAIAVSAAGIYGVLAHWVCARRRELGIRIALGASGSAVARLVAGQVLALTVIGLCIGLPVAIVGLELLRSSLFGVVTLDLVAAVEVIALVVAVSALAAWIPTRRARWIDPAVLLRSE